MYVATLEVSTWDRSTFIPTPGLNKLTATSPMTRAMLVSTSKYISALSATRPTLAMLAMLEMPCTTVQKMMGAMSTRIALMKASPSGCIWAPRLG